LPCVFLWAHHKKSFAVRIIYDAHKKRPVKKIVFCAFFLHGKHFFHQTLTPLACSLPLLCASTRRTANIYVCRAFPQDTRQNIFKKFDFCTSFNFPTTKTLFCTLYFKFIHVLINLLFLTIMCHLKNFCRIHQI
jgi:hypothetical protein